MPDDCNNSDFPPNAEDYLDAISSTVAGLTAVCGVLFVLTVVVMLECAHYIMGNFNGHMIRLRTILILAMYPAVSLCSMLVLLFPRSSLLLEMVSSVFVALALYNFVTIIPEHFGGLDNMVNALKHETAHLGRIPPCCCCVCFCPTINITRKSIQVAMGLGVQSAIVHPFLGIITMVLWLDGKYEKGKFKVDNGFPYLFLPTLVSTIVTLYGISLLAFVSSRQVLSHLSMKSKLYSIKVVLILRNTQGAIFSMLAKEDVPDCDGILSSDVQGEYINQMLFILEMFLLMLLARRLFRNPESGQCYPDTEAVLAVNCTGRAKYGTTGDCNKQACVEQGSGQPNPLKIGVHGNDNTALIYDHD